MCVIVYKDEKSDLDFKDLDLMWARNSDGAGLAYFVPNFVEGQPNQYKIKIEKGFMKLSLLKNRLLELESIIPNIRYALHLRTMTSGIHNELNTHPFVVSKNEKDLEITDGLVDAVLMHNGVLSDLGNKVISDTYEFTRDILAYVDPVARVRFLDMIHGKFLLLQEDKFYFAGDAFETYEGLKVSNTNWAPHKPMVGYQSSEAGGYWENNVYHQWSESYKRNDDSTLTTTIKPYPKTVEIEGEETKLSAEEIELDELRAEEEYLEDCKDEIAMALGTSDPEIVTRYLNEHLEDYGLEGYEIEVEEPKKEELKTKTDIVLNDVDPQDYGMC